MKDTMIFVLNANSQGTKMIKNLYIGPGNSQNNFSNQSLKTNFNKIII